MCNLDDRTIRVEHSDKFGGFCCCCVVSFNWWIAACQQSAVGMAFLSFIARNLGIWWKISAGPVFYLHRRESLILDSLCDEENFSFHIWPCFFHRRMICCLLFFEIFFFILLLFVSDSIRFDHLRYASISTQQGGDDGFILLSMDSFYSHLSCLWLIFVLRRFTLNGDVLVHASSIALVMSFFSLIFQFILLLSMAFLMVINAER